MTQRTRQTQGKALDWRPRVRGGALGAALATSLATSLASSTARASHSCEDQPRNRYGGAFNLGFTVGFAFAPGSEAGLRITYGLDARFGQGPALGLLRIERYGPGALRFVGAAQVVREGLAAEAGVAMISSYEVPGRRGPELIEESLGIHAAAALWDPNVAMQMQGTLPLMGDRRNSSVGGAAFLVLPGAISLCLPSGRVLRAAEDGAMELPAIVCAPFADIADTHHDDRRALALAWAEAAQAEHASITAFERLAWELQILEAPPSLVRACRDAADDERRHTVRTAAHAQALAFGPLPARASVPRFDRRSSEALALLARESLVDGCFGEGVAAALARRSLSTTRDEDARTTNLAIAHEEARHAELSWAILSWAWRTGGTAVRDGVMEAASGLSRGTESPHAALRDSDGAGALDHEWLAAMGQPSPTDRAHTDEQVRESVLARLSNAPIATPRGS